jgi:hypothetical protein
MPEEGRLLVGGVPVVIEAVVAIEFAILLETSGVIEASRVAGMLQSGALIRIPLSGLRGGGPIGELFSSVFPFFASPAASLIRPDLWAFSIGPKANGSSRPEKDRLRWPTPCR